MNKNEHELSKLIIVASYSWRSLAYPALLVLLGLGFALVPLAKGEFFFYWDNAQQYYPQTVALHRALRSGGIPHWWHEVGSGFPVMAEGQAAHYHPIRLLLALFFSPPVAFMAEIGLYLALAGSSTYFFLREFRLREPACLVGGLCQMLGSFSVVFVKNIAHHRSIWLLPLAMLLAERIATRRRLSHGLAASLVLGLQLISGHPIFALLTIVATAVYILCRVLQRSWHAQEPLRTAVQQLGKTMAYWGLVVVLGFAVAAIQVVPQRLHVGHSIREGGLDFEYAMSALAAQARYLPQLFFPYVYHQGDWLNTPNSRGSYFNDVPYGGIYIGALPVLLALLGFWWNRPWPDPAWSLAICSVIATGLAWGKNTPLFPALWSLPGMNGIRYPYRFLLWASFCLACLAALGLHRLLARSRLGLHRTRDTVPFLLLAGWVLLLALLFWTQRTAVATMVKVAQDIRSGIITSLVLFAVAISLAWGLLVMRRRDQGFLLVLVVLFVFADLWIFRTRSGYAPTVPIQEVMAPPPVVEFLKTDRDQFRVISLIPWEWGFNRNEDVFEFLQPYTCTIWGIESADDYSSLMLKRYYAIHEAVVWELLNSPEAAEKLAGFLGALNVKYVVAPKPVTLVGWERVHQTPRAATWKNPAFLPRAFLVGEVLAESIAVRDEWIETSTRRLERYHNLVSNWSTRLEDAQIVDHILSRPIDYQTTAVVAGRNLPELSGLNPQSEVRAMLQHANAMRFNVRSDKPALLVISNNYYPGWTATVNGQPTQLYRTNYVGMGVLVRAGESEVILRFVTPGFRFGLLATIASLGLSLGGLIVAPRVRLAS